MNAIQQRAANGANVHIIGKPKVDEKPKHNSLMAQIEEKGAEKIELSKNTLWLFGAIISLVTLAISIAPQIFGWIRSDQSKEERIIMIQATQDKNEKRLESIENKLEKVIDSQHQEQIQKAKIQGYELGTTDGHNVNKK